MISISLHKDADIDEFTSLLTQSGYSYTQLKSVPRIMHIDVDYVAFTLVDHPSIKGISKNDVELKPAYVETNVAYLHGRYAKSGDTWAKARICRRKNVFRPTGQNFNELQSPSVAHRQTRTGLGVDVYILDRGFNPNHIEFVGRNFTRIDTENGATATTKDTSHYHGLAVGSCAGGNVYGIAPDSQMYFSRVTGGITAYIADMINSIDVAFNHYLSNAASNRPGILNMSWTTSVLGFDQVLSDLVSACVDAGMVFCAPTGNNREDLDAINVYPAEDDPAVIVVGATTIFDTPMYAENNIGSGYGMPVTLFAPGMFVLTAHATDANAPDDELNSNTGTSFATPYVAGVVACMLQGYQRLTNRTQVVALKNKLISNSTKGVIKFPENMTIRERERNRLLYLDPYLSIEPINGLTPL